MVFRAFLPTSSAKSMESTCSRNTVSPGPSSPELEKSIRVDHLLLSAAFVIIAASVLAPISVQGADEFLFYDEQDFGEFTTRGLNRYGQIAGYSYHGADPTRAAVLTPDSSGETVIWFRDDDLDSANDLIVLYVFKAYGTT